ncbi:MAG: TerB family tellurite resistance protein [Pseudomonadales bacterium]
MTVLDRLLSKLRNDEVVSDDRRTVALAAGALLLEVAWADHEIADSELEMVRNAVQQQTGLSDDEVQEVVEQARRHQAESVGVFAFTRTINEAWQEPQKFELVEALWRLALSDAALHRYEEHVIRRIAELLYVSHTRFIEAKLNAARDAAAR